MADVDPILTVTDNTTHNVKENSVPVVNEESTVVDTEHAAQHTENAEPLQDLDKANEDFTPVEPAILPCPAQESTASISDAPSASEPEVHPAVAAAEETPQIWIKNSTTPLVVKPAVGNAPYHPTQVTACLSTPAKAAVDKAWHGASTLLKKRKAADDEPLVLAQEAKKKKEKNPKAPIITDLDAMAAQLRGVDHVEALTAVGIPADVEWCDMTKAEYEKEESFVKEKDQPDW